MYESPDFNYQQFKGEVIKVLKSRPVRVVFLIAVIIVALGFASGELSPERMKSKYNTFFKTTQNIAQEITPLDQAPPKNYVSDISYEQAVISAVASASPSVVSIVISKYVPVYEQEFINPFGDIPGFQIQIPQQVQKGSKYQEIGAGSGFIVSEDGLVLTNKHVVSDKKADYTVFTNDGKKYTAKVVALDPVQDLAVIKITDEKKFPSIKIGNSEGIQIGQGVIAIGNALGQFSNTVSVGIVSGLGRTISAGGANGFSETLEDIIQTDAAINQGNSGGPLLNLRGEVIGINTATAVGAQTIGFAIPINVAKRDIDQIIKTNKITYPFLGVRYTLIDDEVKEKYKLTVDSGAYVLRGDNGEAAVIKDSPAKKAGIQEKDIVLEVSGKKVTKNDSLARLLQTYTPGDTVTLKMLRDEKEMSLDVVLAERPE